jgi:hypothetical protein
MKAPVKYSDLSLLGGFARRQGWSRCRRRSGRLIRERNRVPKYVPDSSELQGTPLIQNGPNAPKWPETGLPDRILSPETRVRIPVAVRRGIPAYSGFRLETVRADRERIPKYVYF